MPALAKFREIDADPVVIGRRQRGMDNGGVSVGRLQPLTDHYRFAQCVAIRYVTRTRFICRCRSC